MRKIIAFETPDRQRFFNEGEAREHERRYDFGNQIDTAVRSEPQFARLDREMLIDYFMEHGSAIGKLADSPIAPQELRGIPSGFSGTLEDKRTVIVHKHTGIASDKPTTEAARTPVPGVYSEQRDPIDAMADELDRELNKSA